MLCDVIPTSSASTSVSTKFSEIAQAQTIPNKRLKVVLSKKMAAGDEKTHESIANDSSIDMRKSSCGDDELKIEIPIVDTSKIAFIETANSPAFDPDMPCCSHQMFSQASTSTATGALAFPAKLKIFPRKATSPATANPSILLNQPSLMNVKKSSGALKLRNSFASIGTNTNGSNSGGGIGVSGGGSVIIGHSSLLRTTRRSSSSLSKDGRKLKKKKSLKADATLKRKKSRVF